MTEIFRTVLNMSITTAYICLAVMLLRLLMKKLPKKYSYALWIIPFFRMVCPFSIQSAVSLFNFIKPENAAETIEYIPSNTVVSSKLIIDTGISLPSVAGGTEPVEIPLPPPQISESANPMQIIMFVASILWLTGLGFLLIYSIFCFVKMRAIVKDSEFFSDNVYVCKNIDSPFVFGVIKPKIYIPEGISEEHMTYILAHEKVHIRRRDYFIKPLGFIACAVHWFNPLVWVGFKLMERDMEQSCDEIAINGFETDVRKQYAETLLDISMRQNKLKGGQLVSFGENSVKSRIKGVISMKKPTIIISIIAVVVVAIAAVCLLTNGKEEKGIPLPENEAQAMELIGVLRSDIVHDWGEPYGTLSGMWGDIWENDDTYITLYFEGTDLNDAVICGVHYEDKKTGDTYIIPSQAEDDDLSTTTSEHTSSADAIDDPSNITPEVDDFSINSDLMSEVGMTYSELSEKYNSAPDGTYKGFNFKGGYGNYGWKSSDGAVRKEGGCNIIVGVASDELFTGVTYPLSFDDLQSKYGFVAESIDTEKGLDDAYWSVFTHPSYTDVFFIFSTKEYGVINDGERGGAVELDVDCLEAYPVTFAVKLNSSAEKSNAVYSAKKAAGAWTRTVEYFSTEEEVSLYLLAGNAASAYLHNDKEKLVQYLSDESCDTGLSEYSSDIFNELEYFSIKMPNLSEISSDKVYIAVCEYAVKGNDMLLYLDIGMKMTDDGWKIEYINTQG